MTFKRTCACLWGGALIIAGFWFFLIPFSITSYYLKTDQGLTKPGGSSFAFASHKRLSKRYARYANDRIESGIAKDLPVWDIAGTEWPLFGSVFYLRSTLQLQKSWQADPTLSKQSPAEYASEAIEAATNLVLDEGHAGWVIEHWGDDYLERGNVFYRMLIMWAIITHHELTGSDEHLDTLRGQVESLAAELDASPHGLLDDYPNQCYPTDVAAALAAIAEADPILNTDHSAFLQRSLRGFSGPRTKPFGLPAYAANAKTGAPYDPSRGCGNSYFCSFAPYVWPDLSPQWYATYVKHFWQQNWFATGFREFPNIMKKEWYFDVDAGPVIGGFGSAASAFGVAAARTNGDFKRGSSLSAEMIAYSGPLANGRLLLPSLVSNPKHAPYLGETAIVFQLSCEPIGPAKGVDKITIPGCVWILLIVELLFGGLFIWQGSKRLKSGVLND